MSISQDQNPIETGLGARPEPDEILSGIDLRGKNALVTGGYSGIGLETTRALVKAGAHVHVPARRPKQRKPLWKALLTAPILALWIWAICARWKNSPMIF